MKKLNTDNNGFSAFEFLLVIVTLAIIGIAGYFVAKHIDKKTLNPVSTTVSSTSDPYSGWKTATLLYEKIKYQYPSNWTVTNESSAGGCAEPGSDDIYLTSPNNEQIQLRTGVSCIGDAGAVDFGTSIPITALGQNLYLAFENWAGEGPPGPPNYPEFACLGITSTPNTPLDFVSKNIILPDSTTIDNFTNSSFCYYPYNELNDKDSPTSTESVSTIENSPDFATAKLVFESMHY